MLSDGIANDGSDFKHVNQMLECSVSLMLCCLVDLLTVYMASVSMKIFNGVRFIIAYSAAIGVDFHDLAIGIG